MVGLALVVFVAIFAAGLRATIDKVDRRAGHGRADRHRTRTASRRCPTGVVDEPSSKCRGVDDGLADALRDRQASRGDERHDQPATGVDPATIDDGHEAQVGRGRRADAGRRSRTTRRWSTRTWPSAHDLDGRAARCSSPRRAGKQVDYKIAGMFNEPGRADRRRARHQRVDGARLGRPRTSRSCWSPATPGADAEQLAGDGGHGAEGLPVDRGA